MSNYGWASYANQLKQRVITQNAPTYHRKKGRMIFKRIRDEETSANADYGYRYSPQNTIGFEMIARWAGNRHRNVWMFRCYLDGLALYRKSLLHYTINRYPCTSDIDDVIQENFYIDTEIPDEEDGADGVYSPRIQILRRKPLCNVARSIALRETASLGDYLVRKYNFRTEEVSR